MRRFRNMKDEDEVEYEKKDEEVNVLVDLLSIILSIICIIFT